jgi:TolB protein
MDLDGSHVQTLAGGAAIYQSPAFSPDGARIAFSSNRDGDFSIYVMNRDGTGVGRVTGPGAYDDSPSWSPDGSRLVFTRLFSLGAALMVVKVDGTGETALTPVVTSGYLDSPAWSPDGAKIAYTGGGTPHIYVMNADGSGATPLPALPGDTVDHAAWSPDGARLAVHDLSHGIVVMKADGSNPVALLPSGDFGTEPAWSPDGASIVFTKIFPGSPRIARIKGDGTGEMELTTGVRPWMDTPPGRGDRRAQNRRA